jgi:hypothetical protein
MMLWLGVVVVSAGCTCNPRIDVRAVGYENLPLRVDLVGVNPDRNPECIPSRMSDYWEANSEVRKAAERGGYQKEMKLQKKPNTVGKSDTMYKTDSVWKTWEERKVVDLYILILPYKDRDNPPAYRVPFKPEKCWCDLIITIESGNISVDGNKCSN